jgi:hypothetical protein
MLATTWLLGRVIRFVCSLRPTYSEAVSRYWADGKSYESYELPNHVEKALSYIRAAGGNLDNPDFDGTLKYFDEECRRNCQDPWGHSRRKIRATLVRWSTRERSSRKPRTKLSKLVHPIGFYRPSFREAHRRYKKGVSRRQQPVLAWHILGAMSYVSSTTDSLDRPDFDAALVRFHEWTGREELGELTERRIRKTLTRWSVRTSESLVMAALLSVGAWLKVLSVLATMVGILTWSWFKGYHFSGDYQLPRFQNPRTKRHDWVAPGEVIAPALVVLAAVVLGWLAAAIIAAPALVFLGWSLLDRFQLHHPTAHQSL